MNKVSCTLRYEDPLERKPKRERMTAPKVLEAEFIAYFAAGGTVVGPGATPVTEFEGAAPPRGPFGMPIGRIDLVGITLEIFGPTPTRENAVTGTQRLLQVGRANRGGHGPNSGTDQPIDGGGLTSQSGQSVPEGWLVNPHGSSIDPEFTAAEVERIIQNGIHEAELTRAAIRLDGNFRPGARTRMVFAVSDSAGEVLGTISHARCNGLLCRCRGGQVAKHGFTMRGMPCRM